MNDQGPGPATDENGGDDNAPTTETPETETAAETAESAPDLLTENERLRAENVDLQNALNDATTQIARLRESAAVAAASAGGQAPSPVGKQSILYSTKCIAGQVFTGQDAIDAAKESGDWYDSPADVPPPPPPE